MDPELVIVLLVFGFLAVALLLAWRGRHVVVGRREELRRSTEAVVPILSQGRMAAVGVPTLLGPPLLVLGAIMLLDDPREHALLAVGGAMVAAMIATLVVALLLPKLPFVVVGRLRLTADALSLERGASATHVDLRRPFVVEESTVLPDRTTNAGRVETVVSVSQGDASVVFRYPCLFGESSLAPEGVLAAPLTGTAVDATARALHERLRSVRAR